MTHTLRQTIASLAALFLAISAIDADAQIFYPMEATDGSDFDVVTTVDTNVQFGIDYSSFSVGGGVVGGPFPASIPEAPNTQPGDAPRTGHFVEANLDLLTGLGELAEVALIAKDPDTPSETLSMTGDYEVQVDIWMNYQAGSGVATEYGGLLLGHDAASPGRLSGAGLSFTGDSGAAGDFRLRKAPENAASLTADGSIGSLGLTIEEDGTGSDGQYNPEIGLTYYADDQFDSGVFNAVDNENDFWQEALPLRNLTAASFEPTGGQGAGQSDPTGVNNPPGDPGFRWITLRYEVEPETMGTGAREAPGVARIYLQGTWRDDLDGDDSTTDDIVTVTGDEVFVGTIDNSNTNADLLGNSTPVFDFSDPIGLLYADLFSSVDETGLVFGVFDNLIVTPETTGGLIGDADGDGDVDGDDLIAVQTSFGDTGSTPLLGDADFDGDVDGDDLIAVQTNFGATSGVAVPEPTAALLTLIAIAATPRRRPRSR